MNCIFYDLLHGEGFYNILRHLEYNDSLGSLFTSYISFYDIQYIDVNWALISL